MFTWLVGKANAECRKKLEALLQTTPYQKTTTLKNNKLCFSTPSFKTTYLA